MNKPLSHRKAMVDKQHQGLSLVKQCKLLKINRSSLYYKAKTETELNLKLMMLMDTHYLEHPYKGSRRMHTWLTEDMDYKVSLNRIERLYYSKMCLRSIMPGPHTSKRNHEHKVYPYLLRNLDINRVNQVWATDITYIPMAKGFMYLTAIIDVYSRHIVHWSVSNSMEASWCAQTYREAVEMYGPPEILNTDQGSQYTSEEFTKAVLKESKLSMDGKGRATDNAYIETFWKTIKYEKIYISPPQDGLDLYEKVRDYIKYYNNERRHTSLGNRKPSEAFFPVKQPRSCMRAA